METSSQSAETKTSYQPYSSCGECSHLNPTPRDSHNPAQYWRVAESNVTSLLICLWWQESLAILTLCNLAAGKLPYVQVDQRRICFLHCLLHRDLGFMQASMNSTLKDLAQNLASTPGIAWWTQTQCSIQPITNGHNSLVFYHLGKK